MDEKNKKDDVFTSGEDAADTDNKTHDAEDKDAKVFVFTRPESEKSFTEENKKPSAGKAFETLRFLKRAGGKKAEDAEQSKEEPAEKKTASSNKPAGGGAPEQPAKADGADASKPKKAEEIKTEVFVAPLEPAMPEIELPSDLLKLPDVVDETTKRPTSKKRSVKSAILRVSVLLVCIFAVALSLVVLAAAVYLMNVTQDDDADLDLNTIKLSYSTVLLAYDKEAEEYYNYQTIFGEENRRWINYEDMPPQLINALVASEDQRFWKHGGVDWKRTIAAFINEYTPFTLFSGTQGGSTIDQQLIKNLTEEKDVQGIEGALRKLREIYRALSMEKEFSKQQILEAYLNTFRLSGTLAGVEAAANFYFGKTTAELTAAECAAIVCVTKSPTAYNPFFFPEENKLQRDTVLIQMHEQGYLSDAQYAIARSESNIMEFSTTEYEAKVNEVYTFFTDTVVREVLADLQTYNGLSSQEANDLFYTGGLTVYITIDQEIQGIMDEIAVYPDGPVPWEYSTRRSTEEKGSTMQAAATLMNYEGELLAVMGGIGEKTASLSTNYAVGFPRSTGSSMKPLAAYAPAMEVNKIGYGSTFMDSAVKVVAGNPWPRNYEGVGVYSETYVSVASAIALSLNTVAVRVFDLIGSEFAYDFLTTRFGITTLDPLYDRHNDGSLALGGLTNGVSVLEMTAAYATFGNGGFYYRPHSYTKVVDYRGNVVLDNTQLIQPTKSLSNDTAFIMNKLLQGVMHGSGTGVRAAYSSKMELAGKSGTSTGAVPGAYDYWFIGMNPYYVMGVWQGYVNPPLPMTTVGPSRSGPRLAWRYVMSRVSADLEYKDFPMSDDYVRVAYCTYSGLRPVEGCTTAIGYYKRGTVPGVCSGVHEEPAPPA